MILYWCRRHSNMLWTYMNITLWFIQLLYRKFGRVLRSRVYENIFLRATFPVSSQKHSICCLPKRKKTTISILPCSWKLTISVNTFREGKFPLFFICTHQIASNKSGIKIKYLWGLKPITWHFYRGIIWFIFLFSFNNQ